MGSFCCVLGFEQASEMWVWDWVKRGTAAPKNTAGLARWHSVLDCPRGVDCARGTSSRTRDWDYVRLRVYVCKICGCVQDSILLHQALSTAVRCFLSTDSAGTALLRCVVQCAICVLCVYCCFSVYDHTSQFWGAPGMGCETGAGCVPIRWNVRRDFGIPVSDACELK